VKQDRGYFETVHKSKDPTTFVIFFEDTAALLGLLAALIGISLGHYLHIPELDGAASIVIGLILSAVAILLAIESKGLLIGEAADPKCLAEIRAIAEADPSVELLRRALTMHFGPHEVLLNMEIQFKHELTADDIATAIDRIEVAVRAVYPDLKHIFLEAKAPVAEIPPNASPYDSLP
jgi:divalent metal cation (Fe/Co/Zn/Cd) transporter